jgi:hypothetical protein
MNGYAILADAVVAAHIAYVGFVIFGQLAILIGWPLSWGWIRNPWFRMIHVTMIMIVVVEAIVEFECPLTTWEDTLREAAGQGAANGDAGFIARNLDAIMFSGRDFSFLVWIYYGFGAVVVLTLFLAPPRFRKPHVPANPAQTPEPATISEPATAILPPPKEPQPK